MSFFSGSINVDFSASLPFLSVRFLGLVFGRRLFVFLLCVRAWFCGRPVEDDDSMNKEWKIMLCLARL